MTTPTPADLLAAHKAATDAERAWRTELFRAHGDNAVKLTWAPEGKGKPGSPLAKEWAAVRKTTDAWQEMHDRRVK